MLECATFYEALRSRGIQYFTGVPDSLLKEFCAFVSDHAGEENHVIAANEGGAVALATGHYLATGAVPLVYMQNSGQGNAVNPLTSLADPEVYGIPMLLLIGWRGEPGKPDEPQHCKQGRIMHGLFDALEIPHATLPSDAKEAEHILDKALQCAKRDSTPFALVVSADTFGKHSAAKHDPLEKAMLRERAIELIIGAVPSGAAVVGTTGKASRELFEVRRRLGGGHEQDFLTVGSMGHASQLSLGIAMGRPHEQVWCIDGDGSLIMHMGSLAVIGQHAPTNLVHIVLNNAAHESVGGQPTAALGMNIPAIAKACGYKHAWRAENEAEIQGHLAALRQEAGPCLLEVRISKGSRGDLGRPTHTPREAKEAFMEFLSS